MNVIFILCNSGYKGLCGDYDLFKLYNTLVYDFKIQFFKFWIVSFIVKGKKKIDLYFLQ